MVNVPIFNVITGLFTGKTKELTSPSAANTRTPGTTYASQYPYNYSQVTRAGHEIQLDDTPGNERMRFAHKSGSYTEVSEDGRKVEVVTANDSKTVKQSTTITIEKNGDIKIGGAARIVIGGDAHLEVKGNMNTVVGGDYNLTVGKSINILAKQNGTIDVDGSMSLCSGQTWLGGSVLENTKLVSCSGEMLLIGKTDATLSSLTGNTYITSDQNTVRIYGKNNAQMVAQEGQAGVYGILGTAGISGNTYVAITAAGDEAQDPSGVNPPMGGDLRLSGNNSHLIVKDQANTTANTIILRSNSFRSISPR
jgi:hypothetical protein